MRIKSLRFPGLSLPLSGLVFVLAAMALASPQARAAEPPDMQLRIVGGTPAETDEYPFMAGILYSFMVDNRDALFCGASLVAADWVLTAAHCVAADGVDDLEVLVGATDLGKVQGERIGVRRIVVHPDYFDNEQPDAALVQLARPVSQTSLPLLSPGSALEQMGTPACILGWGMTSENGPSSDVLQAAEVEVIADSVCRSTYASVDSELELCAGLPDGGSDACGGDSGGPLLVRSGDSWHQLGIVARGVGCARPALPGIYTRVSALKDWIQAVTATQNGTRPEAFGSHCKDARCTFQAPASDAAGVGFVAFNWTVNGQFAGSGGILTLTLPGAGSHEVVLTARNLAGTEYRIASWVNVLDDSAMQLGEVQADMDATQVAPARTVTDPVAILGAPSYFGANPGTWRMEQLNGDGFRVRFQEWDYLRRDFGDTHHARERSGYLMIPAGRYAMSDGSIWQFGRFELSGTGAWRKVYFDPAFPAGQLPALFLGVQSNNGSQAVTARVRKPDEKGFEAALFEEEALMDGHMTEQVAYLAVYSPAGQGALKLDGRSVGYQLQQLALGSDWQAVGAVEVKLEEEQSRDQETGHTLEDTDVLLIDGRVFVQPVSSYGPDTVSPRMR